MTDFLNRKMQFDTSLVHVGSSNRSDYLQVFNRKRKTKWDENIKPCKFNYLNKLDVRNSRRTHWGPEYEKTFTPLTIARIPDEVDTDTFEILIRKNRFEDVNRRLQCSDWENVDPDIRSPSPEPIYDPKSGHRLNTRDVRNREKYMKEKNSIIEELIILDPTYRPPSDYKPPKKTKKIYINEYDNEKHKLVGLILGPHGVTQRELEKKSGCRISVRGKGSNWTNNSMDRTYHDENEPLHVYLVADKEENIRKGMALVEPILDPISEEHFKHKQMQKNAVAVMYGYQTETACENCGERHRTWACPLNFGNFTKADVKCAICGEKSHPTYDCPERNNITDKKEEENDLLKFIKEIDELKKNAETLVLEAEKKADDIRNSVIFTGKIPEPINNFKNSSDVNIGSTNIMINNDNIPLQSINTPDQFNKFEADSKIMQNNFQTHINEINQMNHINQLSQSNLINQPIRPFPPQDFRLPVLPILENPNVVRAPAINYINPLTVPNMPNNVNNYYMNQFMYSNSNIPFSQYPGTNQPNFAFNRPLNAISNNFQGKIPMSYGMNPNLVTPGMMSYPRPPVIGINTNMSIPNVNYRMNFNQTMIRPSTGLGMNNLYNINTMRTMHSSEISQPPEPQEPQVEEKEDDIQINDVHKS